ncbi:MAG: IS3 family transposase [Planctomycetota bacterium]|nr:MAG: IS3 family transposase [Planctomycetota bacterium]
MRYKFMFDHHKSKGWPLRVMARLLCVSLSGYHAWIRRPNCPRHDKDAWYQSIIKELFEQSRQTYGSPRIFEDLRALGHRISEKRVARLMREMGISPVQKRRSVRTTVSDIHGWHAPNLLDREFRADAPNIKWVGDITYIDTHQGWLYLATVIDLFSRRVVGWAFSTTIDASLVCSALSMAVRQRKPAPGVIFHSDRGSQYASHGFRSLCTLHGIEQSMSGRGDCYDNAVAESFFHSLKIDLVHRRRYQTTDEARSDIFSYIEGFYNACRRHSTINYCSPEQWEQQHAA